jgi:hypothetical protein
MSNDDILRAIGGLAIGSKALWVADSERLSLKQDHTLLLPSLKKKKLQTN